MVPSGPILLCQRDESAVDDAGKAGAVACTAAMAACSWNDPTRPRGRASSRSRTARSIFADTDWPQILELYRMLLTLAPNPAAELGAAIALSEVEGPEAGLAALEPLAAARPRDHRIIAARAHLLEALGRPEAAAFRQAAALTDSIPEQDYLNAEAGPA